jgi:hypothetical protein
MLTAALAPTMFATMVPEIWVDRTADRLIAQHGAEAVREVSRIIELALRQRQRDRALLMLRVRTAIKTLQAPPSTLLH